jgi:2-succinyl-5-enolpyruvyl-6-hydroxy-3-cyclohexene-1-carboxylate synthase
MEHLKEIVNIAEVCAQKGVKKFVLSPGSRCAPLTISLLRHPEIDCITVTDERSAAFIAMGIAQQSGETVGLVCTSGTAVLNYYPAITEAFYQGIPLLVLTADRPPEWIDQFDNQSIRQKEVYSKHILKSFETPVDLSSQDSKWHFYRIMSEAINTTSYPIKGPVHVNVPLREPLYPKLDQDIDFDKNIKIIRQSKIQNTLPLEEQNYLLDKINSCEKIMIVAGMNDYNYNLVNSLEKLHSSKKFVVISDITSNTSESNSINNIDSILTSIDDINLAPDLIISFGNAVISKNLKTFIKKYKPKENWFIKESGLVGDTYQSLTNIINVTPEYFFDYLSNNLEKINIKPNYSSLWIENEISIISKLENYFEQNNFSELDIVHKIMKSLPNDSLLQLGNSMSVRYASYVGLDSNKKIKVNSNRGTSGIDGSISTSVGACISSKKITTVITGDLSFFYDKNSLWNNYVPEHLRIVILNNHGGGIFRILDGSSKLPELDNYFETKNNVTAENMLKDYNCDYFKCSSLEEVKNVLSDFYTLNGKFKVLEVQFDSKSNTSLFNDFKIFLKK